MPIDPDGMFTKLFPEVWLLQEDITEADAAQALGVTNEVIRAMSPPEVHGRLAAQRTWIVVQSALQQKKLLEERQGIEDRKAHR